ncbi:MAG: hypothetical protein K0U66_10505 [Gammaproteobacteria bacterium]|nr:hypothetical protein [Gammaproteobacteria bacterium]
MSTKPKDFLVLAVELIEKETKGGEIHYRTAVNRCYFCVFLKAREYIKLTDKRNIVSRSSLNSPRAHAVVVHFFSGKKNNDYSYVCTGLHSLANNRKNADYKMNITISKKKAAKCYEYASSLINRLDKLEKEYEATSNQPND